MAHKTLLIGLGSMGVEIADYAIETIEAKFGSLAKAPWFKVIAIDTAKPKADVATLRTGNFISNGVTEVDFDAFKENGRLTEIEFDRWKDPDVFRVNNSSKDGASNIRMIGRASMLHPKYFTNVFGEIRKRLDSLPALGLAEAIRAAGLDVPEELIDTNSVNVIVVGSLLGGTCSGSFIDVGYWLRNYAKTIGAGTSFDLSGIFSIPHANYVEPGNERRIANVYAALQEANHYMMDGAHYSCKFPDYPRTLEFDSSPPYDSLSLVMPRDANDRTRMETHAAVGEFVAAMSTSQMGRQTWTKIVDPKGNVTTRYVDGQNLRFMSIGLASLVYPASHIENGCAAKLAAEALNEWITRESPSPEVLNQELVKLSFNERQLTADLLRASDSENTLSARIEEKLRQAEQDIARNKVEAMETVRRQLEEGFQGGNSVAGGVGARKFLETTEANQESVKSAYVKNIADRIDNALLNIDEGPNWCKGFLEAVKRGILDVKQKNHQLATSDNSASQLSQLRSIENEIVACSRDGLLGLGFRKHTLKELGKDWHAVARSYWNGRLNVSSIPASRSVLDELEEMVDQALLRLDGTSYAEGSLTHDTNGQALIRTFRNIVSDLQERAKQLDQSGPLVNGFAYFRPGVTIDEEFREGMKRLVVKPQKNVNANRSGEAFARASLVASLSILDGALTDSHSAFDPIRLEADRKDSRPTNNQTLNREIIDSARVRFTHVKEVKLLEKVYGTERNKSTDVDVRIQDVWEKSEPFIKLDDLSLPSSFTGKNVGFLRPAFSFSNNSQLEVFPYKDFAEKVEALGVPGSNRMENADPTRAIFIRAQLGISIKSIHATEKSYRIWFDKIRDDEHSPNLYSRNDVVWRPLDSSHWHPHWKQGIGAYLYAMALGLVEREAGPGLDPYILRIPDRNPIRLPYDLELGSYRLLTRNNEGFQYLRNHLVNNASPQMEGEYAEKLELFIRTNPQSHRGLKYRGESNEPSVREDGNGNQILDKDGRPVEGRLSRDAVRDFILSFVEFCGKTSLVDEYLSTYRPSHTQEPSNYFFYGTSRGTFPDGQPYLDGYYCDGYIKEKLCNQYFGGVETFGQPNDSMFKIDAFPVECPNCGKSILAPGFKRIFKARQQVL